MVGAPSGGGSPPRHTQIGAAVIRRGGAVLLVRQRGPGDPAPTWSLPGGRVEPGELPAEAMVREVREETGVDVLDPGRLLYVTAVADPQGGARGTTFVFAVARWQVAGADGEPDPQPAFTGDSILEARFVPLAEAVARLERLPWRMIREPAVAHLRGEATGGTLWQYRQQTNGPVLVGTVPAAAADALRP